MLQQHLQNCPPAGVSHNPEIVKRVMLPNGAVPHVTTFAQATFRPGQVCTLHRHATMYEIYLVESGCGQIHVEGRDHQLTPGVCLVVEPGEEHSVRNDGADDLVLTYFGIAHEQPPTHA
jgi:mannose-6-phosphate isomerase-like protein (cupin superfamily)